MSDVVKSEVQGVVQLVTINRPEARNALNSHVLTELERVFQPQQLPAHVAVAVITGSGDKAFVAGADIREMVEAGPSAIGAYVDRGQRVMKLIEHYPVPVIAAVNGYALGGGMELALACDIIYAASTAQFGQPEVNLGIIPGFGGTQRLLERCSIGAARKLVYSGEIIPALKARELGIVDEVTEPADLMTKVTALAQLIGSKGPLAVRKAKRVLRDAYGDLLNAGLKREVAGFVELFGSHDREEGMKAFIEKRPAKFSGH